MSNAKRKPVPAIYADSDYLHEFSRRKTKPAPTKRSLSGQQLAPSSRIVRRRSFVLVVLLAALIPVVGISVISWFASGDEVPGLSFSGVGSGFIETAGPVSWKSEELSFESADLDSVGLTSRDLPDVLDLGWLLTGSTQVRAVTLPVVGESRTQQFRYTIKRGDTLARVGKLFGYSPIEAAQLQLALSELGKSNKEVSGKLRIGLNIILEFSADDKLREIRLDDSTENIVLLRRTEASIKNSSESKSVNPFKGELVSVPHVTHERVAIGVIESSLTEAATKAGVPYDVVDSVVDLFASQVSFSRDLRAGDKFVAIYEDKLSKDGDRFGAGEVLAVSLNVNGKRFSAIRFVGTDGRSRYFDENAKLMGNTFLRYPVKFTRISSVFSDSRFHPVLKKKKPHNGVDFAAPTGTPVRAPADGVVQYAGWKGPNGKLIKIGHGARYQTAYAHLSKIRVKKGQKVSRGDIIGAVGTTGRSTGPHLHYVFYDRGRYVDPLKVELPTVEQLSRGQKIDKSFLSKVNNTLRHYEAVDVKTLRTELTQSAPNG